MKNFKKRREDQNNIIKLLTQENKRTIDKLDKKFNGIEMNATENKQVKELYKEALK